LAGRQHGGRASVADRDRRCALGRSCVDLVRLLPGPPGGRTADRAALRDTPERGGRRPAARRCRERAHGGHPAPCCAERGRDR
jgi:hypothetical protein